MAGDRSKLVESAQKYLAKGQYSKAITAYRKLVESDSSDVRAWLKLGDLYTRKGAKSDACEAYERVAKHYANRGFFLKAVAIYKQVLRLDPLRIDACLELGRMYEQLELSGDALTAYDQATSAYLRDGKTEEALSLFRHMTNLDPESVVVRIRHAEALSKAGRSLEAADEFEVGTELLEKQERWDDYIRVAERLLFHRPKYVPIARKLAELYLERNQARKALAKLQTCFHANPRHVPTLDFLARVFIALEQPGKAASVYREIARIHQEDGKQDERARALKKVLELAPDDPEARRALAAFAPSAGPSIAPRKSTPAQLALEDRETGRPAPSSTASQAKPPQMPKAEFKQEEAPPASAPPPNSLPAPAFAADEQTEEEETRGKSSRAAAPSIAPPDIEKDALIARLLTESEVLYRYGLQDKMLEQLEKVLELDPNHPEANARIQEIRQEAQAQPPQNQLPENQIQASQQEDSAALDSDFDDLLASSETDDDDEVFFIDEESGTESYSAGQRSNAPQASSQKPTASSIPSGDAPKPVASLAPPPVISSLPAPRVDVGRLSDPAPKLKGSTQKPATTAPPPNSEEKRPSLSLRNSNGPALEVEEVLDEAEFFVVQGLFEEARATIEEALHHFSEHPLLTDMLRDIENQMRSAAEKPSAFVSAPEPQTADLAEDLAQELEVDVLGGLADEELDIDSVFEQFQKGVEENVGLDDTDTHFDLGIAYKEMGLLEDAIREFEISQRNPDRECLSLTMIGMCHAARGEMAEAIRHFKQGLYAEVKTAQEELALYYELGQAYEELADPAEAVYYYRKVHHQDPRFRHVQAKINKLGDVVPNRISSLRPPPA